MDIASLLNQTATYWAPGSNDGYGGLLYPTKVEIVCRWQNVSELFRDSKGREAMSLAIVYTTEELATGGYLLIGNAGLEIEGSPMDLGAHEIRHFGASPSLRADQTLYKAIL